MSEEALFRIDGAVKRDAGVDAWLQGEPGEMRRLAKQWFERMRGCGADVVEAMHDGCPVACVEDAPFAYVNAFKSHVSVGFFRGSSLPDPSGSMEGGGKRMRHVKLVRGQAVDARALESLIEAAYRDIRAALAASLPRRCEGGVLRRLRAEDLADFQAYRSIPEVGRYQGWTPMAQAQAREFLAEMGAKPLCAPGEWVQLAIAEAGSDRLLGDIGLHVEDDGRSGQVGFTLAPHAQGRGIATRALGEAVRLFFAVTEAEEILGITDLRNAASIRLLERAGFTHRETVSAVFRGEPCSEAIYVLRRRPA